MTRKRKRPAADRARPETETRKNCHHSTRIHHGFPPTMPDHVIEAVNDLARRDLNGERVPWLVARWQDAEGRWIRMIWRPRSEYFARFGGWPEDGGAA